MRRLADMTCVDKNMCVIKELLMSGNDVNNAYLSILKSYQQIDQQYSGFTNNALLNSSIFSSTGASSSSSANKTAMWLGIASIAGSALTAGASIFGTIAMNKSMRQAASAAAQQTNTPTVDYKSKTADELTQAKSKLNDQIEIIKRDIENLNIEKNQALEMKKDYDRQAKDFQASYDEHNGKIGPLKSSLTTAETSLADLEAKKKAAAAASTDEEKKKIFTSEDEQEYNKLSGKDTDEGSVAYIKKQIKEEEKARDEAFKNKKDADEKYTLKTKEAQEKSDKIQSKNTEIENKKAEIAKIEAEEARRVAQPQEDDPKAKKGKKK